MAKYRTIKPEFWEDEKIAQLPIPCRLFYIGTWNFADDNGVFRGNAAMMKSKIFPYDCSLRTSDVSKWISALVKIGMLIPLDYKNEKFYKIRAFLNHQKIDDRYSNFIVPEEVITSLLHGGDTAGSHAIGVVVEEMVKERGGSKKHPPLKKQKEKIFELKIEDKPVVEIFHRMCPSFAKVSNPLSNGRKEKIARWLAEMENDVEKLKTVFEKAENSDFLKGVNERDWVATFDWIFENWQKILEGKYDNKSKTNENDTNIRLFGKPSAIDFGESTLQI